ncbi:MAG: hypothetical protein COX57_03155 [Alphaproteobacteria bacterium CG_4_10_14_0_2_um_filter_63_37]|nr:MAG: hypothetical protein AUJ55_03615 [Proteobacteria bacterium CG1_02_64_396]PJA25536.1 MAG: hypothetical protein COX57_03155 [Alphaproteobacteria bacterium CG_4_10_14_0_2_um_filter_63_37]
MILRLDHLTLNQGGRPILSGANALAAPGRVTVLLGPNGAGKSTLLAALAGLHPIVSGQALWGEQPLTSLSRTARAQTTAWLGQRPPDGFGLTVHARLLLARAPFTSPFSPFCNDDRDRVTQALEWLDLEPLAGRPLESLSGGERQRVELAAQRVHDGDLWLCDEPTAHLDLKHQAQWLHLARDAAARGKTVIAALHDLHQAVVLGDVFWLLPGDGRLIEGGKEMMNPQTLQGLFGVSLQSLRGEDGPLVLPDYRYQGTHP